MMTVMTIILTLCDHHDHDDDENDDVDGIGMKRTLGDVKVHRGGRHLTETRDVTRVPGSVITIIFSIAIDYHHHHHCHHHQDYLPVSSLPAPVR